MIKKYFKPFIFFAVFAILSITCIFVIEFVSNVRNEMQTFDERTLINKSNTTICQVYIDFTKSYKDNHPDTTFLIPDQILEGEVLPPNREMIIYRRSEEEVKTESVITAEDCEGKIVFSETVRWDQVNEITIPPLDSKLRIINESELPVCSVYLSRTLNDLFNIDWLGDEHVLNTDDSYELNVSSNHYYLIIQGCEQKYGVVEEYVKLGNRPLLQSYLKISEKTEIIAKRADANILIENYSGDYICGVYINNSASDFWGMNWLLNDFWRIGTGTYRRFAVPKGKYKISLIDCNENILYENTSVTVNDSRSILVEGKAKSNAEDAYYRGSISEQAKDFQDAVRNYETAAELYDNQGDLNGKLNSLISLARIHKFKLNFDESLDILSNAELLAFELGNDLKQISINEEIGDILFQKNQYDMAESHYQKAVSIISITQEDENRLLGKIGWIYERLGDYQTAADYYQIAHSNEKEMETGSYPFILLRIGHMAYLANEFEYAISVLNQAIAKLDDTYFSSSSPEVGLIFANNYLGEVYYRLGLYSDAGRYFSESSSLIDSYTNPTEGFVTFLGDTIALTEMNMGKASIATGDTEIAQHYFHSALDLYNSINGLSGKARVFRELAKVDLLQEDFNKAEQRLKDAYKTQYEIGERVEQGITLADLGNLYIHRDVQIAIQTYLKAIKIFEETNYQDFLYNQDLLATAFFNLGKAYESNGDPQGAIEAYKSSVLANEYTMQWMFNAETKSALLENKMPAYKKLIKLLWNETDYDDVFHYIELARSRGFLSEMAGAEVDFGSGTVLGGLDYKLYLLREDIRNLQRAIYSGKVPDNNKNLELLALMKSELKLLESQLATAMSDAKVRFSACGACEEAKVLSISEIQALIDNDTTIIEYYVDQDELYIFVIEKNNLTSTKTAISEEKLQNLLIDATNPIVKVDKKLGTLKELYGLLMEPVELHLTTSKLGIIPYGILHYMPFSAFFDGQDYLIDNHNIFYLPSASSLQFIKKLQKTSESNEVLIFGNPNTLDPMPPLPFADLEAKTIADIYWTNAFTKGSATEHLFWTKAEDARIIHLATHGNYDLVSPLFSKIYLAVDLSVDKIAPLVRGSLSLRDYFKERSASGETIPRMYPPSNDGYLELHEIYKLDLKSSTELVVLSGCETNIGDIGKSDELMSLTRGFLYAGTPSVIASLWQVNDESTALLMVEFYRNLQKGMSKGNALRNAQILVRERYPDPYYWSPFVIVGDIDGTLQIDKFTLLKNWVLSFSANVHWIYLVIGTLLLALLGIIITLIFRRFVKNRPEL